MQDELDPAVRGLFEQRAKGVGWVRCASGRGERGSPTTNAQAVRWIIRNLAYLAEARSGELANPKAHRPIITRLLFDRANAVLRHLVQPQDKRFYRGAIAGAGRIRLLLHEASPPEEDEDGADEEKEACEHRWPLTLQPGSGSVEVSLRALSGNKERDDHRQ